MKFIEKPLSKSKNLKNYEDKFTLKQDPENEFKLFIEESHLDRTDTNLVIGKNGKIFLIPFKSLDMPNISFDNLVITDLPGAGIKNVSILVHEKYIYAGANGYVYKLNMSGVLLEWNCLPEMGYHEIGLAITDSFLVVGTNGYVVLVSLDDFENKEKNKDISLPGCGYENVSVLVDGQYIYAGSNGYVYRLDINGENVISNNLPDRGYYDICLAITKLHLVVGTYGYVSLVPLDGFDDADANIDISLPDCGYENVSVLTYGNYIYAGSNGYVYRLNLDGTNVLTNSLPRVGHEEIRLTDSLEELIVGTNGYIVGVCLKDFNDVNKNTIIPLEQAGSGIVSVLYNKENCKIYVICKNEIYRFNDDTKECIVLLKSKNAGLNSFFLGK